MLHVTTLHRYILIFDFSNPRQYIYILYNIVYYNYNNNK